jgi:hypothetical protein
LFLCCVYFTHLLQFHVAYFSIIYAHHMFDKMLLWMLINNSITKYDFLFFPLYSSIFELCFVFDYVIV